MKDNEHAEDEYAYGRDALDELVGATSEELRELVTSLIEHRERVRDDELGRLERESDALLNDLDQLDRKRLVAELRCFKEVVSLHRRLIRNDQP